jgi:hypothetical protein
MKLLLSIAAVLAILCTIGFTILMLVLCIAVKFVVNPFPVLGSTRRVKRDRGWW